MQSIQLKKSDKGYVLPYTIVDDNNNNAPVNLTGAVVTFKVGDRTKMVINNSAVIKNAAQGTVEYTFTEADTFTVGHFMGEFEVLFPDGKRYSYPRSGYLDVSILANVEGNALQVTVDLNTTLGNRLNGIDTSLVSVNAQLDAKANKRISLKDLAEPFVLAHRGGSNVYPENTMDAFKNIVANGMRFIEMDVYSLSDGSLAVMHDGTVDRTTDGTGNVSDFYASSWKALNVDASAFLASGYRNTVPPFLEEIFCEFGDSVIYVPETKDANSTQKIVDLAKKHNLKENLIIQCFSLDGLVPATNEGFVTLALGDNVDLVRAKSMGVVYVGHSTSATDSYIQSIISAGLKPVVYVINKRLDWDAYKAKGVVGCFSDDPLYISGLNTHVRKVDPFRFKTWYHGHLPTLGTDKGKFIGTNQWGWTGSIFKTIVLQGWASPIANANNSYTLQTDISFDSVPADTSVYVNIGVGCINDGFADSSSALSNGYNVLLRPSGALQLYKVTNGVATLLTSVTTPAITTGTKATVKIDVTTTTITVTRTDVASPNSITSNDTTFRGGYVFFGHDAKGSSLSISFLNASVS